MARQVLEEHLSRTDPIVHVSDIESAVSTYFGITTAELHSSKKDRTIALARHFSMYLARKHTKMSTPEIGRCMGNKNHATVLLACKKMEDELNRNAEMRWIGPSGNRIVKGATILAGFRTIDGRLTYAYLRLNKLILLFFFVSFIRLFICSQRFC